MELIVGKSPAIERLKELVNQVVDTDLNVLICGESGVGKDLVAQTLHYKSKRGKRRLVKINCAALPGELLESELFGYERGAFTGAVDPKKGKFELASGGTIFLDEIGDMSIALQAKLLQVLQDGAFSRVGGVKDVAVDVWVISATNHDLELDVQKGNFREDLFYRLNIIKIIVPPLRERKEDLPVLISHFIKKHGQALGKKNVSMPKELLDIFERYHWPGNVRELENYIRRFMVINEAAPIITEISKRMAKSSKSFVESGEWQPNDDLIDSVIAGCRAEIKEKFPPLKEISKKYLAKIEKIVIEEALKRSLGNRREAAELLQISYKALSYKIKNCGIEIPSDIETGTPTRISLSDNKR